MESVRVSLPLGWHLLAPDASGPEWIEAVISASGAGPSAAEHLRSDLARVVSRRDAVTATGRHHLAVLSPDPAVASRVLAAGWVEVGPSIEAPELAEALRSARLPASILSRDVSLRESRRMPAVVCRDLMTDPADASGTLLHERCAVVVVHAQSRFSVRVELSTSDLAAFDDLGDICLQVVDRVRLELTERSEA